MKKKVLIAVFLVLMSFCVLSTGCIFSRGGSGGGIIKPPDNRLQDSLVLQGYTLKWTNLFDEYKVKINDETYFVETNSLSLLNKLEEGTSSINVAIVSANETDFPENTSFTIYKSYLQAAEIHIADNDLVFDSVDQNTKDLIVSVMPIDKEIKLDADTFKFDLSSIDGIETGQEYDITVKSVSLDSVFLYDVDSDTEKFTYNQMLSAPVVTLDDAVISWNQVENAVRYKLVAELDGQESIHLIERGSNDTVSVDCRQLDFENGKTYKIRVMAMANGTEYINSSYSNEIVFTLNLEKLANPEILSLDRFGILSLKSIENATYYGIVLVEESVVVDSFSFYPPSQSESYETDLKIWFSFVLLNSYEIQVMAVNEDGHYINSDYAKQKFTFDNRLDTPVVEINGSIITWQKIINAQSYKLVNGLGNSYDLQIEEEQGVCTFNLTKLPSSLKGQHTFKLIAVAQGPYKNSQESAPFDFSFLQRVEAPVFMGIDTTHMFWVKRSNAVGYKMVFENYELELTDSKDFLTGYLEVDYEWISQRVNLGQQTFYLVALGDGINYADSLPSESKTYTFTRKVDAPELYLANGYLCYQPAENATEHRLFYNNYSYVFDTETVDGVCRISAEVVAQSIGFGSKTLSLFVIGDSSKHYTNNYSQEESYLLQGKTKAASIELDENYILWSWINYNNGFAIAVDGQEVVSVFSPPYINNKYTIDLSNYKIQIGLGIKEVSIITKGDGINSFDNVSNSVTYYMTEKLRTPQIIIEDQTLDWTVENATQYKYKINNDEEVITSKGVIAASELGLASGDSIIVMAMGQESSGYLDSNWSMPFVFGEQEQLPWILENTECELSILKNEFYLARFMPQSDTIYRVLTTNGTGMRADFFLDEELSNPYIYCQSSTTDISIGIPLAEGAIYYVKLYSKHPTSGSSTDFDGTFKIETFELIDSTKVYDKGITILKGEQKYTAALSAQNAYFYFNKLSNETLTINVIEVSIEDDYGISIKQSGTQMSYLTHFLEEGKFYYLEVVYQFAVQENTHIAAEFGAVSYTELSLDTPASVNIKTPYSKMHFKFVATESGEYNFRAQNAQERTEIKIYTISQDGKLEVIMEDDSFFGNFNTDCNVVAGTTYYIETGFGFQHTGMYDIVVSAY